MHAGPERQAIYGAGAASPSPRGFRTRPAGGTAQHGIRHPAGVPRRYAPGECLLGEGQPLEGVFLVEDGLVKMVRHLPHGRARIVRLHGAGSVIGLQGFLTGDRRSASTAVAASDVAARFLLYQDLRRLRRQEPDDYLALVEGLHRDIRLADRWIAEFSTGPTKQRVAALIGFLATARAAPGGPVHEVELFTCRDLGDMLGVTPESVSRILADLKRQNVLCLVPGAVERYVCDMDTLTQLMRGDP